MMMALGIPNLSLFALFYADPGSGALLWQLIGAFFVGLLFYLRRFAAWISPRAGVSQSSPQRRWPWSRKSFTPGLPPHSTRD